MTVLSPDIEGAYREALDGVAAAVFMIEPSGQVLRTNRMGEDIIRRRRWLQVVNGKLCPQKYLKEAHSLATGLARVTTGLAFRLLITEPSTQAQAVVHAAPLPALTETPFFPNAEALVWVIPLIATKDPARDVARLFALTAAEVSLLERLLLEEELRDAAAKLGISIHTARSQLKSIFRKTGRHSQTQLLVLAARLASIRSP